MSRPKKAEARRRSAWVLTRALTDTGSWASTQRLPREVRYVDKLPSVSAEESRVRTPGRCSGTGVEHAIHRVSSADVRHASMRAASTRSSSRARPRDGACRRPLSRSWSAFEKRLRRLFGGSSGAVETAQLLDWLKSSAVLWAGQGIRIVGPRNCDALPSASGITPGRRRPARPGAMGYRFSLPYARAWGSAIESASVGFSRGHRSGAASSSPSRPARQCGCQRLLAAPSGIALM